MFAPGPRAVGFTIVWPDGVIQAVYAAIEHPGTIILPDVLRDNSAA